MGIDIYARWKGITAAEKQKQYTGFNVVSGNVGYLREAYHGGPYGTKLLVKEAFENGSAKIPAKVLKSRLKEVIAAIKIRQREIYNNELTPKVIKSFKDFVKLCEKKEKETGEPVEIIASY